MNCPNCSASMEPGDVLIERGWLDGWIGDTTNLVFKGQAGKRRFKLLSLWRKSRAFLCTACGTAVLATNLSAGQKPG